jgi:predicted glycoside hydrolase/deacetylase ChbG (UPF0249 family)
MPISDMPLLIVNADDFGHDESATDLTIECFRQGAITSATAMVHMQDSERAADRAREAGLPTGLHINFTEEFTGAAIPDAVRRRQAEACSTMNSHLGIRRWTYDPRIQGLIGSAIKDQLERYETLFGGPPTHVDGHNHVHVCPNVAVVKDIARFKRRNALWSWPNVHTLGARARSLRRIATAPHALTTRFFFDISRLPTEDPGKLAGELSRARTASVEVMAHPAFDHERRALQGTVWAETLAALPLGSYRDLT